MKLPPPEILMTWPKPNYIDPHTRGPGVLIVNIVCVSVAFIVTLLRLYTRFRITCSPGIDDILIVIAMGFAIAMCTITSLASQDYGFSRHIWDIPMTWFPTVQKLNLSFQILFSMASSFTKLSLLWFCRRLLGPKSSNQVYDWSYIGAMVFVGLSCALFTLISIFQCNPVHAYWDINPKYEYTCMNGGAIVFAASVINIFTDFLVTVLPMPLIWNLKLPTRQRIAVISIFGLGVLVNVAGSCRTVYVYKSMIASYDQTWMGWPVLISAGVEINLGLICASAPALRPLVASFLPRLLQSTRNYTRSYYQRSMSQKLRSSTGPSKNSQYFTDSRNQDPERLEVLRTVEMETWSEARKPDHDIGRAYGITSHNDRVVSPDGSFEQKDGGTVYASPSGQSSDTAVHAVTKDLPFESKNSIV